ncbi:type I polyketide synthase [Sphaerisporangium sp. NPDC049003]|uniref:type I polyketide synthase n=1 Tax=Sphaerisporangium sp. NPDC049003 TaxID=3364517 RepID=UPI0037225A64
MADHVNAAGHEGGDAVAVIGLACRLPGAPGPEALWRLLRSGGDAVAEPSPERLAAEPEIGGRRGGFLDQVDRFDAGFFGISPREAVAMDPQQRLMLELGWEVLEDAGVLPAGLAGVRAGVFLGAIGSDYATLAARSGEAAITRHTLAGLNKGMLANRVSYFLGLRGPSLTVDTAQSSALVAVHLACESLRSGESTLAIAGGVNLNLVPESTLIAERFGGLSPDGRCFTFDARANGYVRGEGGGLVLLKPLSRALADGDTVHAVIRGGAVNSDGATDGLTVPSDRAQEEVVRLAVSRSGIDPAAVQFVELHGTGTKVGDPVEARALGAALGAARPPGRPLVVGSVKTNIGHLEGAAGIAGLLKAVLSIRHREIPPNLNFETPNPGIDLDALNLRVADALRPWPRPEEPLVAGVSSFGIGGTNCHLVLTEPPPTPNLASPPTPNLASRPTLSPGVSAPAAAARSGDRPRGQDLGAPSPLPFVLSGQTPGALREQAGRLLDVVTSADADLSDLAFSLATARTSFRHRAVLVEPDRHALLDGLRALSSGDPTAAAVLGAARSANGGVVFVFPGQGSQWIGMGRELARVSPVYAEHLRAVASALEPHVDWSPAEVLWGLPGAASFDRVEVVQPALFAVMVALARLWESFGVVPDAVIGHSQGEIAAAHIAGALSLEDAAAIVVLRSQAIAAISGHGGGMVSIPLPVDRVRARLSRWAGRLNIGAVNGPSATVVSGDSDALDELVAAYEAEDVPVRGVRIDYASHSAHVEAVRDQLMELLPGFVPRSTETAFYSSVTGGLLDAAELDAGYWYRNLRHTVEFERAVRAALADGHDVFVEASPHPILVVGLRQILDTTPTKQADLSGTLQTVSSTGTVQVGSSSGTAQAGVVTGTLRRGGDDLGHFLRSAARLHVHGVPVDWTGALPPDARRVPLPTYAFQRDRHWLDRATTPEPEHPAPETASRRDVPAGSAPEPEESGQGPVSRRDVPAGSAPEPEARPISALGVRLAGLTDEERARSVLALVLSATATVLGHAGGVAVTADLPFRDLGLDSLGAVELRDRLSSVTGLPVPATVTFDHPTPLAVARFLLAEAAGRTERPAEPARARAGASPYEEPVALVAMSGRWPGGADTPERLWELLLAGADAISGFPANRGWDLDALYDPGSARPGTSYTREGGFLHDADRFDAEFFGISPREAAAMDPQQRLLLETSWDLLERAGITPESLRGSRTGVFVGATPQDYGPRLHEAAEDAEGYALTGTTTSVVSGRIAYAFGFEGPAVTVDTACSSSMVALHLAVQSLRGGESDLALAGGVAVMSGPGMFTEFSRQRGLARDGRCKPFAAGADGTAWAEGVGLLLVERLSDAERLGHRVLAVIRGTAVNQDGASNGLTAPNGPSQRRVIQDALASAGLRAADVDVVEAHGTGTTLGDPIEAQAIIATYGQNRPADRPLLLGSVKSNIGHAQAAAGVASMIKLVSALEHGVVPKTLHVDEPSGHVDWSAGSVELLTDTRPWPETGRPRRAALSSFGISGTNAHVIIEQPPAPSPDSKPDLGLGSESEPSPKAASPEPDTKPSPGGGLDNVPGGGVLPWVVSARTPDALRDQARKLAEHLDRNPALEPASIGLSLVTTRTLFTHRAVLLGNRDHLTEGLHALAEGRTHPALTLGTAAPTPRTAFLFTGQGSQHPGMSRELHQTFPAYATTFDQLTDTFDTRLNLPVPLREVILTTSHTELLNQTLYTQPALFTLQISLAHLLATWGITPDVVTGHSIGAISAAHIAGILTLNDATTLIATRAHLMQTLPTGHGAMAAIQATEHETQTALHNHPNVTIAALNTPTSTVISGDYHQVHTVTEHFRAQGRKIKHLTVSHAFHSPHMDPILQPFRDAISTLTLTPPTIDYISDLTGQPADPHHITTPDYWTHHLRNPVRFHDATQHLNATTHLELGPDATLTPLLHDTLDTDITTAPLLRKDRPDTPTALTAAATAFTHGTPTNWTKLLPDTPTTQLPTYAFQHERFWVNSPASGPGDAHGLGLGAADHPLLGAATTLAGGDGVLLTGRLSLTTHPWLADHTVLGTVIVPGTAFLELALRAGDEAGLDTVEEIIVEAPLVLSTDTHIQVRVGALDGERRSVEIHSRPEGAATGTGWTRHATAVLVERTTAPGFDLGAWPPEAAEPVTLEDAYATLDRAGLRYGPAFQGLRAAWQRGDELFTEVSLPEDRHEEAGRFGVDPALLDAAVHLPALRGLADVPEGHNRLPFAWNGVRLHASGATSLRVRVVTSGPDSLSLRATDPAGAPVIEIGSLLARLVSGRQLAEARPAHHDSLFQVGWTELTLDAARRDSWAVLGEDGRATHDALRDGGATTSFFTDLDALGEALDAGEPTPDLVLLPVHTPTGETGPVPERSGAGPVSAAHSGAGRMLAALQEWFADARWASSRLVVLTRNAVSVTGDDTPDLASAPIWGLIRSAQTEQPDRILLIDLDTEPASRTALPSAVATALTTQEGQLALRAGRAFLPRLARATHPTPQPEAPTLPTPEPEAAPRSATRPEATAEPEAAPWIGKRWNPEGTVLITGGLGGLGTLLARHLVHNHGIRHLHLTGRQGVNTPGANDLRTELTALGATITITATDITDQDELATLLAHIPTDHPLTAVIHAAGTTDDGVIGSLTPDRLSNVLAPKIDGAWNLHHLTRHHNLTAFILFSSISATLGSAGQANYAAANAFLDALATHRTTQGLPALSLAWGLWQHTSTITAHLTNTDRARITRTGLHPLPPTKHSPSSTPRSSRPDNPPSSSRPPSTSLHGGTLRRPYPPVLRGLVRPGRRATAGAAASGSAPSLITRLAGLGQDERDAVLLALVRTEVGTVLAHPDPASIPADRPIIELGLNSLTAVELRNRLNTATALRLPATLTFDHPTPEAIAGFVGQELGEVAGRAQASPPKAGAKAATGGLAAIHRRMHETGKHVEAAELLLAVSPVRARFGAADRREHALGPIRLATGPGRVSLVCFPALSAISGPHEYSRFGQLFRDERDVHVVPSPGFTSDEDEALPDSLETLIRMNVEGLRESVGEEPFVIVGRSMGGCVAHAVTVALEDEGLFPAGLALIDSYPIDAAAQEGMDWWLGAMIGGMLERIDRFDLNVHDSRLTTMGAYNRLFVGWQPKPVQTPILMLRAQEPLRGTTVEAEGGRDWRAFWPVAHDVADIPGDHFTTLEEHSGSTAEAIRTWVESLNP